MTIILSCTSCTAISDLVDPDLKDYYLELREKMLFTDISFYTIPMHLKSIENKLDIFPSSYRDVKEIKDEFIYINSQFKVLGDNTYSYTKRHAAAMNLLEKDSYYDKWDLKSGINYYTYDEEVLSSILLGRWEDSSGNYFSVYEKQERDIWISYNLPTDKQEGKEYLFNINGNIIEFYQGDEETTRFNVFRIVDISHDKLNIFCYSNSKYYTLIYHE